MATPKLPSVKAGVDIRKLGHTRSARFGANRNAQVRGPKEVTQESSSL